MQSKISAFFKPRNGKSSSIQLIKEAPKPCSSIESTYPEPKSNKSLNKKRSYAQLHLEMGQSDFLLRTCHICGFKYACGDEGDEKVHKEFHKDYTHGIPFKGWNNERVVCLPVNECGRVVLVLDGDPPAHKKKVEKVVEMMETDFGSGWLVHKLCKVYLYIMQKRVVGCLIAEPIETAHRVVSSADSSKGNKFSNSNIESAPSVDNPKELLEGELMGAIFLEEEAVGVTCGIRAIWVAPSIRRKQIATQLLDVVRLSFIEGLKLENSELAFSNPTYHGKALAYREMICLIGRIDEAYADVSAVALRGRSGFHSGGGASPELYAAGICEKVVRFEGPME